MDVVTGHTGLEFTTIKAEREIIPDLHAHHIVPISEGGSNTLENLITLCSDCHKERHSKIGRIKRQHKVLVVD